MPHRVLIVEDDPFFRKVLEIRLKSWEHDIELVYSETLGRARELLDDQNETFSFVILDQRLPDGNGADLFSHPRLSELAVLAVSADESPTLPGEAMKAGAQHFLGKKQVTEALFIPLLKALVERKSVEKELMIARLRESKMNAIKVLVGTLRHEINNPLGAVMGGAYLIRSGGKLDKEQSQALKLVEESGTRIKHVLNQLCEAAELEEVIKASEPVYHIPGDTPWEKSKPQKVRIGRKDRKEQG